MSSNFRSLLAAPVLYAVALVVTLSPSAFADAPAPGQVQRLPVITFSLQVGNTDRESKRVTYTPPPGWYVRSHTVDCTSKHGNVTYAVSTVPQRWHWSSDDRVDESNKVLLDGAAQVREIGGQGRVRHQRSYKINGLQSVQATHHALILDVTAKGEGLFKGGAGIELNVVAELVYLGTEEARPVSETKSGMIELGDPVDPLQ